MAVNSLNLTNTLNTNKLATDNTNKKTNTSANLFDKASSDKTANKSDNPAAAASNSKSTVSADGQKTNNESNKLSEFENTQKQVADSEKRLLEIQQNMQTKAAEQEMLYMQMSEQQGILERLVAQTEKKYNPIEHGDNMDAYVQSQLSENPMYAAASKVLTELKNKNQDIVEALGVMKMNFADEQTIYTETSQKLMTLYNEINAMYAADAASSESYDMLM